MSRAAESKENTTIMIPALTHYSDIVSDIMIYHLEVYNHTTVIITLH